MIYPALFLFSIPNLAFYLGKATDMLTHAHDCWTHNSYMAIIVLLQLTSFLQAYMFTNSMLHREILFSGYLYSSFPPLILVISNSTNLIYASFFWSSAASKKEVVIEFVFHQLSPFRILCICSLPSKWY